MGKKIKYLVLLMLACVPVMKLQAAEVAYTDADIDNLCIIVKAIKFDYQSGSDGDAYNIRASSKTDLLHTGNGLGDGEWRYLGRNEPALYKANRTVKCKVKLQCFGWDNAGDYYAYPIDVQVRAVGRGQLKADLKKRPVKFEGATSSWLEFEFDRKTHLWDGDNLLDIAKVVGRLEWKVSDSTGANERNFTGGLKTGPHTFYTILEDGIKTPWRQDGSHQQHEPWVNALEFAINTVGLEGEDDEDTISQITTDYLFSSHGMKYDTGGNGAGQPGFTSGTFAAGIFDYENYFNKTTDIVNCHDQALAVFTTLNLVGTHNDYVYIAKFHNAGTPFVYTTFGYSTEADLVGRVSMNNPFYDLQTVHSAPVVSTDYLQTDIHSYIYVTIPPTPIQWRSRFSSHGVAERNLGAMGGDVYDATVGPHIKTVHAVYFENTQDTARHSTAAPAPAYDATQTVKLDAKAEVTDYLNKTGDIYLKKN